MVDYAGIAVPVILLTMTVVVLRLHLPELAFVVIADLAGLGLLLLVGLKEYFKWQEKHADHQRLLEENIDLARDASRLLERKEKASSEVADLFLERSDQLEQRDLEVFGEVPEPIRREYYRRALREIGPDATCSCGASPWQFVSGPCQICGGTPVAREVPSHGAPG